MTAQCHPALGNDAYAHLDNHADASAQAIEQWGIGISYGALLQCMTATLNQVQPSPVTGCGSFSGTLGRWVDSAMDFAGMSSQKPVTSTNWPFDLNRMLAI